MDFKKSYFFTPDKKIRNRKQRSKLSFVLSACPVVNMTKIFITMPSALHSSAPPVNLVSKGL